MVKEKVMSKHEKYRLKVAKAYKELFSSEMGGTVLQDLIREAGIAKRTFEYDPYGEAFRNGQRDIVLFILEQTEVDVNQLESTLKEAISVPKALFNESRI